MLKASELYFRLDESKEEGKDQELLHSSTTPGPGQQMGRQLQILRSWWINDEPRIFQT